MVKHPQTIPQLLAEKFVWVWVFKRLSWNLVFGLFKYEEFNADVHFVCFQLYVCMFSGLKPRLIRICRIRWWSLFFSSLDRKHSFWVKLVQKFTIIDLTWYLVPRLIWICGIQAWGSKYRKNIWTGIHPFSSKFASKYQNCLSKLKSSA